jgi:hypothetical protein
MYEVSDKFRCERRVAYKIFYGIPH